MTISLLFFMCCQQLLQTHACEARLVCAFTRREPRPTKDKKKGGDIFLIIPGDGGVLARHCSFDAPVRSPFSFLFLDVDLFIDTQNFLPPNSQAVTVYSLYSADMERVHLRLRATFRNSLRLPISPFSSAPCQAFSGVGYRGENGEVEIEVLEGAHRSQH